MIKIYHVPGTRSVRPIWLCYELELPVEVKLIDLSSNFRDSKLWREISPLGKIPAMEDGELTMFESGAMVSYILERYAKGRLHPDPGTYQSARHHQWCWFAEATLIRPLGLYRILRAGEEEQLDIISEAKDKFRDSLQVVEKTLKDRDFLLGSEFGATDIMMGYSLSIVERLLNENHPNIRAYLTRLQSRDALKKVHDLK